MKRFVLVMLLVAVCGLTTAWAENATVSEKTSLLNYEQSAMEFRNELHQGAGSGLVPGWLTTDLNFYARLRIRYELDRNDDRAYMGTNQAGVADGTMTRFKGADGVNRNRILYMVYFGFTRDFGTDWSAGFELSSTLGDATSRNVTLDGYFAEDAIGISRAYIAWHPQCIGDVNTTGLEIGAGKFANPLVATDMTWDSDVQPEGVYETYKLTSDQLGDFAPFITMAQLIGEEMPNDANVTCQAYQVGFDLKLGGDTFKHWTAAFTYYDWEGLEDALNKNLAAVNVNGLWPNGARTTTFAGNTISLRPTVNNLTGAAAVEPYFDISDFQILNFTTFLDMDFTCADKVIPVQAFFDYAWNEAKAADAFPVMPGVAPAVPTDLDMRPINAFGKRNNNDAISVGFRVGKAKKCGDMEFKYKYAYIETNSIVGALSDGTFGGANREGHVFKVKYMLHDKVWFGTALYVARDIIDFDHTNATEPVLHVEFNVKF